MPVARARPVGAARSRAALETGHDLVPVARARPVGAARSRAALETGHDLVPVARALGRWALLDRARPWSGVRSSCSTRTDLERLEDVSAAAFPLRTGMRRALRIPRVTQHTALSRRDVAHPFDDHPLLAIWEMTRACDLECVHCRASAVDDRDPYELDTGEAKRLLEQIAAMGTPLMVLTGGDPAKRPDLVELIEHGAKAGLTMAVTPSGTPLMTRDKLQAMKDAGMARLAVSVDGHDAASHDAFRRVDGSYAHTRRILDDAIALGIERQINTTLGHHNLDELDVLADFVREVGAVLWSVFVVVPTGRATPSLMLTADDLEGALVHLAGLAEKVPFDVKTTAAPHFRRVQLERKAKAVGVLHDVDAEGNVTGRRGINDGSGFVFISHHGEVFPSGFLPVSGGNVRETDIAEIYRTSPLFQELRDVSNLGGKCGVCPFKLVCGGSRSRAYAMTGDMNDYDPLCSYVPKGWREPRRLPLSR